MKEKEIFLKLIISLLILFFLFQFVDFKLFLENIRRMNVSFFLLAIALLPFSILIRAYRWELILNKDEKRISLKDSYLLTLVGITLNIFLPASSGDIAKSYYGYKWHGIKEEMLSSVIIDKFLALLAVFIMGLTAAILFRFYGFATISLSLIILVSIPLIFPKYIPWNGMNRILFLLFKKRLSEDKLTLASDLNKKLKLFTVVISIFGWMFTFLIFYLLCKAYYIKISYPFVLAIAPLITIAQLFPLTLGGLGSKEAMVVYLFSFLNINPTDAVLISLSSTVVNLIIPGIFGYLIILGDER